MNDILWSAVQRCLDQRRDPLTDPAVEAQLALCPEALGPLLELLADLETLHAGPSRPARPWRPVAAAAGLLLALGLGWTALRAPRPHLPATESSGVSPGRIHSWQVTITHESPAGITRVLCEDGHVRTVGLTEPQEGTSIALLTNRPLAKE